VDGLAAGTVVIGKVAVPKGVPRGPPEWGELLYQPEWASKGKWNDASNIAIAVGLIILTLGAGIAWFLLWALTGMDTALLGLIFFALGILALTCSLPFLWVEARIMPLRVYERGFTSGKEPFLKGISRRETLLPLERISRIEITTHGHGEQCFHSLKLIFEDTEGRTRTVEEFMNNDNSLGFALVRILPQAPAADLRRYIEEQDDARGMGRYPEETGQYRRSTGVGAVVAFLAMAVIIPAIVGLMVPSSGEDVHTFPLVGTLLLAVVMGSFLFPAAMMAVRTVESTFYHEAVPSGGSLLFDPPWWTVLLARVRASLPLSEVSELRRLSDPHIFGHQGELLLSSGIKLKVRPRLFDSLASLPQFEQDSDVLRNRWVVGNERHPLASPSFPRAMAVLIGMLGIAAAVQYGTSWLASDSWVSFGLIAMWVIVAISCIVLVLLVVVVMAAERSLRRAAEGMGMTEEEITLPNAPESMRRIPRASVLSISMETGFVSVHTVLRTPGGSIKLPSDAAQRLKEKGYDVEDQAGREILTGADKRWKASFVADLEEER
jgi:hypothetical protein